MPLFSRLTRGMQSLLFRRREEQELDEELDAYLSQAVEEKRRTGQSREEALRTARAEMGSLAAVKDSVRDVGWELRAESVWQDVHYGLRGLRRSPGFAAVAVLTLALGIGANTAVFALAYNYLFAELPVRDPRELVVFRWTGENSVRQMSEELAYVAGRESGRAGGTFPIGVLEHLRGGTSALSHVAALASAGPINLVADDRADTVNGQFVSGRYYDTLGVRAALGRTITTSDDEASADAVVVLSYQCWTRRFASDPAIVGKGVTLNGIPFTVIGITPSGARDLLRGYPDSPDLSIPLAVEPRLRGANALLRTPAAWWLTMLGRINAGASISQVEAGLNGVLERVVEAYAPRPSGQQRPWRVPELQIVSARHGIADPSPDVLGRFRILGVTSAVILLIVCVNVSSLLLSRSVAREREIVVRTAVGATRARVFRQLLTESLVLAGIAGSIGLLLAAATGTLLSQVVLQSAPGAVTALSLPVQVFTVLLTLIAAAVFGLASAYRVTRRTTTALGNQPGAASVSRTWPGRSLVITQVALSLPLLVGASLFVRTLTNLHRVDPGFDVDRLVLFTVRPELSGYQGPRAATLYRDIENRLLELPGVRAVTSSAFGHTLLDGGVVVMYLPGGPAGADLRSLPSAGLLSVEDDFFTTLGIPLNRGRTFAPHDTRTSTPVAVVNETLARTLFPGADPIGKTFSAPGPLEIVGVVADAKVNSLREPAPLTIYRSVSQLPLPGRRFVVRTEGEVRAQMSLVREAIRQVDPHLALQDLSTQLERIDAKYLTTERMFAAASTSVGVLALAVTVIGLFGLMSYAVERRTKEIGIRMALGARRDHVLRSILKEALITVGSGAVLGLVVALAAGQFVASLLFAISPRDPGSLVIAALLMLLVAGLGGYVPSRRATRVDPLIALRCE